MTETNVTERIADLEAARAGIVSAMMMHVELSEKYYLETQRIDADIAALQAGARL